MTKLKLAALAPMIADRVKAYDTELNRAVYKSGMIPRYEAVQDIDRRFRWDILWALPRDVRQPFFDAAKKLGGNDNHIDSLLKSLVAEL